MKVVGTIFIKDNKLLLVKSSRRTTYQLPAGKVENGETILEAAIRECHEELGKHAIFNEEKIKYIKNFNEIASSDNKTIISYYLFIYEGTLKGRLTESEEIKEFVWYETKMKNIVLSNSLKNKIIPYCIKENLIK